MERDEIGDVKSERNLDVMSLSDTKLKGMEEEGVELGVSGRMYFYIFYLLFLIRGAGRLNGGLRWLASAC